MATKEKKSKECGKPQIVEIMNMKVGKDCPFDRNEFEDAVLAFCFAWLKVKAGRVNAGSKKEKATVKAKVEKAPAKKGCCSCDPCNKPQTASTEEVLIKQVIGLRKKGLSIKAIAKAVHKSDRFVRAVVNKAGL